MKERTNKSHARGEGEEEEKEEEEEEEEKVKSSYYSGICHRSISVDLQ